MNRLALSAFFVAQALIAQSGVEAFIPMLTPSQRVEPQYPDSARAQHVQGFVQLLLTITPQGAVAKVEVLSGPKIFQQAAIDAAKQWQFRPVIRNGIAVRAMTNAAVNFLLPGEPRTTVRPDDQIAATERVVQLEREFPRSPAQVLADLEQASAGDTGIERFFAMRGLAKAAVKAGDLKKAQTYAAELLSAASQYRDNWNYGNAIHDGNMVLGMVALRNGDRDLAKRHLLEAGKTPGSPQLGSFGPNVSLAKELLEKNERDAVLEYFSLCAQFWKMGAAKLQSWTATIRRGATPNFGANLLY